MKLVFEYESLKNQDERGRFLREKGLHSTDLKTWKKEMSNGLESHQPISGETKRFFKSRIEKLESELDEAMIIIETQKKIQNLCHKEDRKPAKKKR